MLRETKDRQKKEQYEIGDLVQLQLSTGQFINGVVVDREKDINKPDTYGYIVVFTSDKDMTHRRRFFAEDMFYLNKTNNPIV